tara:strand:- start:184 stop:378 length:195 start_codon:yes stop_codon:yes gene_type:complete
MTTKYSKSDVYNMPLEEKVQKGIFMAPVLKRRLDAQDLEIAAIRKENAEFKMMLADAIKKLQSK